jgi:arylsulfatase A-like enzyme
MFSFTRTGIALILLVSSGCSRTPPTPTAPVVASPAPLLPLPSGAPLDLAAIPLQRVMLRESQRDARNLPPGSVRIDLAPLDTPGQLRLAVLPAKEAPVLASVYLGNSGTALPEFPPKEAWCDLTRPVPPNTPVSVVLKSDAPFSIATCALQADARQRPDVFVYLIDTLRKDHLGCYGYPLLTSPNIDAFAADAVKLRDFTPMAAWTRPSVTSLLTGTMDYTHHALSPEDHPREGLPSLAKTLGEAGWETLAQMVNPAVGSEAGYGKDFSWHTDVWRDRQPVGWETDAIAVDAAIKATEAAGGREQFLYLHTMAPHRDYQPHEDFTDKFMPERFVGTRPQVRTQRELALYDAEIATADRHFGTFIAALKAQGRYENALIVLVSDHGEQFMEHGELAHSNALHFAEMGAPCLIKLPGNLRAGTEVREVTRIADLMPTILEAVGLPIPSGVDGRSLLPQLTRSSVLPPLPAFARLRIGTKFQYMAQTETLKYLHDVVKGNIFWYDRENDPMELAPMTRPPAGGEELQKFAEEMAAKPVPEKGAASPPLSPSEQSDLKALGYL